MGLQAWKDYQWSRLSQVQSNNTSQFQFIEVQYVCMYFNHVSGLYSVHYIAINGCLSLFDI
jgi:hypothetical protein